MSSLDQMYDLGWFADMMHDSNLAAIRYGSGGISDGQTEMVLEALAFAIRAGGDEFDGLRRFVAKTNGICPCAVVQYDLTVLDDPTAFCPCVPDGVECDCEA